MRAQRTKRFLFVGILLSIASFCCAQTEFKVPISFYDFHTNISNPDFNSTTWGTVHPGIASWQVPGALQSVLDGEKKPLPVAGGPIPLIGSWFREWHSGDTCTYILPPSITVNLVDSVCTPYIFDGETLFTTCEYTYDTIPAGDPDTVKSDTCMKNIKVADSAIFTIDAATGYVTAGSKQKIFPLDGRGFNENDAGGHNEGWTMEMHNQFVYQPGQKVTIGSDDDSWLFINNHLAIDLGGWQAFTQDSVGLDTMGLTAGTTYNIDFFAADRMSGGTYYICTNVNLVNTSIGAPVLKPSRNTLAGQQKFVSLGRGQSFAVPIATAMVELLVTNASGKTIKHARYNLSEQGPALHQYGQGVYVVKVRCFDNTGGHIADRMIVVPLL